MQRRAGLGLVIALVAAACGGQAAPERSPLPEIPPYVPDQVIPPNPEALFPADGSCAVASGTGAQVMETIEGYGAAGVLLPGDLLVEIDGRPVSSREELLGALTGRGPGDDVAVGYERLGQRATASVTLQQAEDDPSRGLIGVMSVSAYSVYAPGEVPAAARLDEHSRMVLLEDDIYLFDPLGSEWELLYVDVPVAPVVALNGTVYGIGDASSKVDLRVVGSDAVIDVVEQGWLLEQPLTSVGDLVLVSGFRSLPGRPDMVTEAAVLAVDVTSGEIAWSWEPGSSPEGLVYFPGEAYRNLSGDRAVISLVTLDPDTGEAAIGHAMLDASGEELSGWGAADRSFVPDNSFVSGFFEDGVLAFSVRAESGFQTYAYVVASGDAGLLATFEQPEDEAPPAIRTVGNGRHLIVTAGDQLLLVDTEVGASRPLVRGCTVRVIDYGGFPT